jgi:hypothetical protein
VIGGHAVAEHGEHPRHLDPLGLPRLGVHVLEVGRPADVRGVGPLVAVALGDVELAPAVVPGEHVLVVLGEHVRADRVRDGLPDLVARRPDVPQVDLVAARPHADGLVQEVNVHPPDQRVRDAERRGGQVVVANIRVDASLEVAVP